MQNICGGRKAAQHTAPIRISQGNLKHEADKNNPEQRNDESFNPAKAQALQHQNDKHIKCGDNHANFQRNAKQQIEADRRAHHLGHIGCDNGNFRKQPQHNCNRFWKSITAGLRQITV